MKTILRSIYLFWPVSLLLVIVVWGVVHASDHTLDDYAYRLPVCFTNNGASITNGPAAFEWNPAALIANGFVKSDLGDLWPANAAGTATPAFAQDLAVTPATAWIDLDTLPAGQTRCWDLHMGNATATRDQGLTLYPDDFVTVSDDASLDINTDLTLETTVRLASLPTDAQCLVCKDGAYELQVINDTVWGVLTSATPPHSPALVLRADAGISLSGSSVTAWADSSGNGNDVAQGTGDKQPTLTTGAFGHQNGVTFDGVDDLLVGANFLNGSAGAVFALVHLTDTQNAGETVLASADEASGIRSVILQIRRNDANPHARILQINNDTQDNVEGDTTVLRDTDYIVTFFSTGTAYGIRLDSDAESLSVIGGSNNGDWFSDTADRDNVTIGALKQNTEAGFLKGHIGVVLAYDSALTTQQIEDVEDWITAWQSLAVSATVTTDTTYDVRMTYDGADLVLYVNDVQEDTTSATGSIATNANDVVIGGGITGTVYSTRIGSNDVDSPTWALDLTYEPTTASQTQQGTAGNSWTWLGAVVDQSAATNDAVSTFVRDISGLDVVLQAVIIKEPLPFIVVAVDLPDQIGDLPDLFTPGLPVLTVPGHALVISMATHAGVSQDLAFFAWLTFWGLLIGAVATWFTKLPAIGLVVLGAFVGLGGPMDLYALWMAIVGVVLLWGIAGWLALMGRR